MNIKNEKQFDGFKKLLEQGTTQKYSDVICMELI